MEITDAPEVTLLESLRHEKGVSLETVVKATGVAHRTIRSYERGQRKHPTPGVLKALADYYEVSATDLLVDIRRRAA